MPSSPTTSHVHLTFTWTSPIYLSLTHHTCSPVTSTCNLTATPSTTCELSATPALNLYAVSHTWSHLFLLRAICRSPLLLYRPPGVNLYSCSCCSFPHAPDSHQPVLLSSVSINVSPVALDALLSTIWFSFFSYFASGIFNGRNFRVIHLSNLSFPSLSNVRRGSPSTWRQLCDSYG